MKTPKNKTVTELRSSLFETFDEVASGKMQIITHKNGNMIAMLPLDKLEALNAEVELHKNLAIGYAQALRGEGITTKELKKKLKNKEEVLRKKYA